MHVQSSDRGQRASCRPQARLQVSVGGQMAEVPGRCHAAASGMEVRRQPSDGLSHESLRGPHLHCTCGKGRADRRLRSVL